MQIGELSKQSGCSIQTIRFYEKSGLIAASGRSQGNFRLFNQEALDCLLFIKSCRALDLSLEEIRQILGLSKTEEIECTAISDLIDKHVEQVNERIESLSRLKDQLVQLKHECGPGLQVKDCGILRSLSLSQTI